MTRVGTWQEALSLSGNSVWSSFAGVLPTVIGAVILFSVGLIIALWVKRLIVQLLKIIQFEKVSKRIGSDNFLKKADIRMTTSVLVASIVEWLIILTFFLAVVDVLGLTAVSEVLSSVLGYIPNIIAAAFIFGAGYFLGNFIDGVIRGAISSVDRTIAKPIGRFSRWLVIVMAFFAAVDQLKIAQGLIATFFQGLAYTLVLVIGLSVGLGAKDLVSRILNDWYEKIHK